MSAPQRARLSQSFAAAAAKLPYCAAADVTLPCGFATLPLPVVLRVFALLPADARARAAAVCHAWHYQLAVGPSAWRPWTELDLSETSGVTCTRGDAALVGAAALARGRLRTLKLRDFDSDYEPHNFSDAALLRVVAANAGLEELTHEREDNEWAPVELVQALLAAAPALQRLTACVATGDAAAARAMLRGEPPYGALHLKQFCMQDTRAASLLRTADGVIAFAADVAATRDSLYCLRLHFAALDAPAALQALVDAALTRPQLLCLDLHFCTFEPAVALPQLARLLADGRSPLRQLRIGRSPTLFADAQGEHLEALCDALATCTRLNMLELKHVGLHGSLHAGMASLLRLALASRPVGSPAAVVIVE